jgi:carbonic anhydrase
LQFQKTGNQRGKRSFTLVLNCTNSRVVHELGIAKGIEDLIDIRVAGDIPKDKVIGSVKYAAKYLGSKLIVATGLKNCEAAKASMSHKNSLNPICSIINTMKFLTYLSQRMEGDPLGNAPMMNAYTVAEELNKMSPLNSYDEKIRMLCLYQATIKSAAAAAAVGSYFHKFIHRISK